MNDKALLAVSAGIELVFQLIDRAQVISAALREAQANNQDHVSAENHALIIKAADESRALLVAAIAAG